MDEINKLKELIEKRDAIMIGAGAGLSTSAGFNYTGERFEKYFFEISSTSIILKICILEVSMNILLKKNSGPTSQDISI